MSEPSYIWTAYGLPAPVAEYRFAPPRKWRFDWAWLNELIAVEIEGGIWSGGRHTRGAGFAKDMEKYNEAAKRGWRMFRFQPVDLKKGNAQMFMSGAFRGLRQ